LVAKIPTMGGLASHFHERLINTKRDEGSGRDRRKMGRKGKESSKWWVSLQWMCPSFLYSMEC